MLAVLDVLLAVHFIGLMLGAGGGFGSATAAAHAKNLPPGEASVIKTLGPKLAKLSMVGFNEGNFKWYELIANDKALGGVQSIAPRELLNKACSFLSLHVFLKDHKAQTLDRVVGEVQSFIAAQPKSDVRFMLAAGIVHKPASRST